MIDKMLQEMCGDSILHKAFALQDAIKAMPEDEQLTKEDLDPLHYFADGMYLRSLFLPEGLAVVGEVHKHAHFTILAEGKSTIVSQDGKMEVEAPFVFVSTPNAKRCVYAETDCTWITVHLNHDNCMDLEELESRHLIKDEQELLEIMK